MTKTCFRAAGHTLAFKGAPHTETGLKVWRPFGGIAGSARCSCGALSTVLVTGAARKNWHKIHKITATVTVRLKRSAPVLSGDDLQGSY